MAKQSEWEVLLQSSSPNASSLAGALGELKDEFDLEPLRDLLEQGKGKLLCEVVDALRNRCPNHGSLFDLIWLQGWVVASPPLDKAENLIALKRSLEGLKVKQKMIEDIVDLETLIRFRLGEDDVAHQTWNSKNAVDDALFKTHASWFFEPLRSLLWEELPRLFARAWARLPATEAESWSPPTRKKHVSEVGLALLEQEQYEHALIFLDRYRNDEFSRKSGLKNAYKIVALVGLGRVDDARATLVDALGESREVLELLAPFEVTADFVRSEEDEGALNPEESPSAYLLRMMGAIRTTSDPKQAIGFLEGALAHDTSRHMLIGWGMDLFDDAMSIQLVSKGRLGEEHNIMGVFNLNYKGECVNLTNLNHLNMCRLPQRSRRLNSTTMHSSVCSRHCPSLF